MDQFHMEDIRAWMDQDPQPQMLFEENVLRLMNRAMEALWPQAKAGIRAEELFGSLGETLSAFSGTGSLVFSAEAAGAVRDFQLLPWGKYTRVSLLKGTDESAMAAIDAVARSILTPLSNVMAVTPELLPILAQRGNPRDLRRAAQLNQGLYTLMRTAGHLQSFGGDKRVSVSLKTGNICQWLTVFTEEVCPLAEAAGRQLRLKLPGRDYMCAFDQDKLKQALLNLISNAIKFTGDQGEIELQLRAASRDRICISLRDNGCGMTPGRLGTVFAVGAGAGEIPDPRQGIGLGLPLTRAIVQAHQGSFLLESREGEGTTAYLYLRRMGIPPEQSLRSRIKYPVPFAGFSELLVELADALPASAFDTRDVDG